HVELDEEIEADFGNTFTGDFRVGPAEAIHGPFDGPKQVPMDHALGAKPEHYPKIADSRICGSCHSVVLPVYDGDEPWSPSPEIPAPEFILEQATYPEWVFSDYRDGGAKAESCQGCHMRSTVEGLDGDLSFKIASIQEASNFPETDNRRPKSEIDLDKRTPFSRHTLVGLNVFFVKFAQQFPDLLGIRVQDPMLTSKGIAPLATAYDSMVHQARHRTAAVEVTSIETTGSELVAEVQVTSDVGHKFPSGVGFRRAFLEFSVIDGAGDVLWASGQTSPLGVIVDELERPVAGELWWKDGCEPTTAAEQRGFFQPHYDEITRQDQAQIYQELVRDPDDRFTTSFLAIAHSVKDNRLLPSGWEPSVAAVEANHLASERLSAEEVVHHVTPVLPAPGGGKTDDPWYVPASQGGKGGGGDELTYRVRLDELEGVPASVRVRLHYQAIPPFYLQDRFCTAPQDRDTQRLYFLAGHADLDGTEAAGWKLEVVSSGEVAVPNR
ncbi:MAG TPA: hypothetical protein VKU40_08435, partial [Thermoanaerobaculia bacterium]|nr:hypothetical protein [Thermoanaerobaculia bacterium]